MTWTGILVGASKIEGSYGNFLQGDATITYDFSDAELNARFANIIDIDAGRAFSAPRGKNTENRQFDARKMLVKTSMWRASTN